MSFTVKPLSMELLHKQGMTKFYPVIRCMKCFGICAEGSKECCHCNYKFYGKATEEEKQELDRKAQGDDQ